MEADTLEEKVVAIFEKLGCNIPIGHIEACHRISKRNQQSLSSFRKEKTTSKFGMSKETCEE